MTAFQGLRGEGADRRLKTPGSTWNSPVPPGSCRGLRARRVHLFRDDPEAQGRGVAAKIKGQLEEAGVKAVVFDGAEPNPTDTKVQDGLKVYQDSRCDAIASLGGGSAHDCAKGIGIDAFFAGSPGILKRQTETPDTTRGRPSRALAPGRGERGGDPGSRHGRGDRSGAAAARLRGVRAGRADTGADRRRARPRARAREGGHRVARRDGARRECRAGKGRGVHHPSSARRVRPRAGGAARRRRAHETGPAGSLRRTRCSSSH